MLFGLVFFTCLLDSVIRTFPRYGACAASVPAFVTYVISHLPIHSEAISIGSAHSVFSCTLIHLACLLSFEQFK